MPTDSIVLIALGINFLLAILAFTIPRLRARRSRIIAPKAAQLAHSSATDSPGASTAGRTGSGATARDAGTAWFPPTRGVELAPGATSSAAEATDAATGLALAPAWTTWLSEEEARIRRFHRPSTIVLVEVSGLDRLADRLGDDAAQRLIPPIGMTMRRQSRASDHLARLGPTRFGAILTETDEVRAINFVERIRTACDVWLEAGAVMLRLSVGWADISTDRPAEVALPEAERRLYEERQRIGAMLSRNTDEPDVEAAMVRPARSQAASA
ncbi:MAG TPA: diguanylate cyclase [Candidatus Bathyarchaeia archaeon]|nr:diguanylate cyclase [Candidatus Bathyarchaeia archaeon]